MTQMNYPIISATATLRFDEPPGGFLSKNGLLDNMTTAKGGSFLSLNIRYPRQSRGLVL
jgi:hypothetical protein